MEAYESDRALLELQEMVQQGSLTQEQALEQHDLFCQERFGLPLLQQLQTACRELYKWMVHGTIPASFDPNHNKNKSIKNKSNKNTFLFAGPSPMFHQREENPMRRRMVIPNNQHNFNSNHQQPLRRQQQPQTNPNRMHSPLLVLLQAHWIPTNHQQQRHLQTTTTRIRTTHCTYLLPCPSCCNAFKPWKNDWLIKNNDTNHYQQSNPPRRLYPPAVAAIPLPTMTIVEALLFGVPIQQPIQIRRPW